ncbi:Uncharacterised protein [Mycobacteroides abscessus subsp. massiliense]|uniref:hypothetical protein n=1 Tax=Mycobacteroides abscessus TaxID=36809 RepID=UPI0009A8B41C|nr:hypothetical protein [Mycobacteroides abscessus]MDO3055614.1 hypothetical protein [Mycobacteroides abscessus subsp. massiliense]SLC37642.1 Uncharacterised protein [Mycobacteroides abscessus subsp. massiliense]SLH10646.1 Uncharacterised protein [Mycobacteroides abscessus subsp. massiliense]SLI03325.1 Uncharacterised protein [Mycobacteroides abscessus subsp. massiliense]
MIENVSDKLGIISPLLTYDEAGSVLRKSGRFVRNEVYAGRLSIKRIGRTPYVHRDELDRYIAAVDDESGADAQRPEMTPAHKRRKSA